MAQMWPIPETDSYPFPSPPLVRVTPVGDARAPCRSMAVLSTGRTPSVTVKPLPEPSVVKRCFADEDENDDVDDVHSWSSHCESGFHGDDDVGMTSSSSPTSSQSTEDDVRRVDVASDNTGSPKVKTKFLGGRPQTGKPPVTTIREEDEELEMV